MSILTSYSEAVRLKYKTNFWSFGTLFNGFILLVALIVPYLICYRTQGFWVKLEQVHEQPIIQFKHEALLMLETTQSDKGSTETLIWTTFPGLYSMLPKKVTPFVMSREGDENMDRIKEYLDIEISIPISNSTTVRGVHLILLFDYRIYRYASLQMESLIYTGATSGVKGNRFEFYGDIGLVQKQPLWTRVHDERYDVPVIPRSSSTLSDYSLTKILKDYTARNVSTKLTNEYRLWLDTPSASDDFVIKGRIYYPKQTYECWAGFWNTLKWAWIQYMAVFIVVGLILRKFQRCIYKANFFETNLVTPWSKN